MKKFRGKVGLKSQFPSWGVTVAYIYSTVDTYKA